MRPRGVLAALVLALGSVAVASAANPPAPPPEDDFLAYLGSWAGDDGDWQVAEATMPEPQARPATSTVKEQPRRVPADGAAKTAQERKP